MIVLFVWMSCIVCSMLTSVIFWLSYAINAHDVFVSGCIMLWPLFFPFQSLFPGNLSPGLCYVVEWVFRPLFSL